MLTAAFSLQDSTEVRYAAQQQAAAQEEQAPKKKGKKAKDADKPGQASALVGLTAEVISSRGACCTTVFQP